MNDFKIDKNYNFVDEPEVYETELADTVDMIVSAKKDNVISELVAQLLIQIAVTKEIKREAKNALPTRNGHEIRSLFMNMKSSEIEHAK